jgi:hypothetical protein
MSILEMPGIENIQGQRRGTLLIETLVSRRPVRWRVRCGYEGCGLTTVVDHMRLQNGFVLNCPNVANHGLSAQPRKTGASATVGTVPTAVRSRDSQSIREFQRQRTTEPTYRWKEPSADTFKGADPDSLRRYLDSMENR